MKSVSINSLLDVQISTKAKVEGVTSQDDLIKLSLTVMTTHLAKLLPVVVKLSIDKSRKIKSETIVKELGPVLEYAFVLCNACGMDIPDDEDLADFEDSVPAEVRHDAVLTLTGMISAVADLFHIFYVEADSPPWENEGMHEDLAEIICTVIVGMKHLGDKFGFSPEDVVVNFS